MSWNKSTVTDSGVVLLNESLAGHTLTITSAVGGAGTLDDDCLLYTSPSPRDTR